jgi:hypothetical protein
MLIKVNKEGEKVFNLSFGNEEPEVIVKRFTGSAERARIAAAEANAIAAGISTFMELYGGYSSDNNKPEDTAKNYYDQKYIDELEATIKTYETNILNLSNLINQEHSEAENAVKNRDTKNLDINNNLAEENLKKMKDLTIELKNLREKLEAAKKLPHLSAERARIAAEEAAEILNSAKKIDTSTIITGGYVESVDIEINNLQNEINNLKKKILNLNNKTSQEYSQAKNNIVVKNKLELEKNNSQAEEYLKQMKNLQIQLDNLNKKLKDANKTPESSDDGYANNGPAAFPGSADPSNKFKEGDYVIATGSRKREKQKFIGKTGKIIVVLEKGIGKNTSKMTRYDVDFGALGRANFKESRLKLGKKEDYKSVSVFNGGDPYYEKYLKYKQKYLELKSKI